MEDSENKFKSEVSSDSNEFSTNFTMPDFRKPESAPAEQIHNGEIHIQVMVGPPQIKLGHIALVLHNPPISPINLPDGSTVLVPCIQLNARQAMEIAMNIIYIAKIAETQKEAEENV
jgi:hypothetical protein